MSRKLFGIAVLVVLLPLVGRGQYLVTGNRFVSGTVSNDGLGHVTWFKGATAPSPDAIHLSFYNKSFLSFFIDGKYYTNNDLSPIYKGPPANTPQTPTILLRDGISSKVEDTIRTTWQEGAFDIVQEVYPVAFSIAGQIIARWYIVNHSAAALNVQSQFLLDVDVNSNDRAQELTEWGFMPNWTLYPNAGKTVPNFFHTLEFAPGRTNFPGLIGTGYVTDSVAPMPLGLHAPATFVIGGWAELSYYTWGYPDNLWNTAYGDNAILYQWAPTRAPSKSAIDSITEVGRISYGTGEIWMNYGEIAAMLMHPGALRYNTSTRTYSPNPFKIHALIFNMNSTTTISNVKATLTVNDSLHITSAITSATSPSNIAPLDVGNAEWTVSVATNPNDSNLLANVSLDLSGNGLHPPVFLDSWDSPVSIALTQIAGIFPKDTIISRIGSYDGSLCNARCSQAAAYDLRLCAMCGISGVHTDTAMNMSVTVQDSFAHFTACVLDSMKDGFANVIVSDFDGSRDTVHFNYCTIDDTLRPSMTQGNCKQGLCYTFGENRPWDRGIDTIKTSDVSNLNISFDPPAGSWRGSNSVAFTATPIDPRQSTSVCLEAIDLAGNRLDTCITVSATAGVENNSVRAFTLSVVPNPSYGFSTIAISNDRAATIEVLDLLGRVVDRFDVAGSRVWDISRLPSGTYIVRASWNGVQASTRIVKE